MENAGDDFLPRLREKLEVRAGWLETTVLPMLREQVRTYRVLAEGMLGILVKKGLVPEDRYGYDRAPEALEVPPDTQVPEASEAEVLGSRLEAWCRQLGFLLDRDVLNLQKLDLPALEKLASLVSFIDWSRLGEGAPGPTTRVLSHVLVRFRLSPDAISARVLHESVAKLQALADTIRANQAHVELWRRETWKADVRSKVMPILSGLRRGRPRDGGVEELAVSRRVFERTLPEEAWRQELFLQILEEDRGDDSEARREKLLASLDPPAPEGELRSRADERREKVAEAVRDISRIAGDLDTAEATLRDNERLLYVHRRSFLRRLLSLFRPRNEEAEPRFYEIVLREPESGKTVTEKVDFLRFVAELRELRSVLSALSNESAEEARRIQEMKEDELRRLLDWQAQQLRHVRRWMEGFNDLFQVKAAALPAGTAPSVKLVLLRIENSLARAGNV